MQKLKGKMVEKEFSGKKIADSLNIDTSTFYRKLKDEGNGFTIAQVFMIVKTLSLTKDEALDIFFAE